MGKMIGRRGEGKRSLVSGSGGGGAIGGSDGVGLSLGSGGRGRHTRASMFCVGHGELAVDTFASGGVDEADCR